MSASAPKLPQDCPTRHTVSFDGRDYPLLMEPAGWRLRSRSKSHTADFRTGTTNLQEAKKRAREWLAKHADDPARSRRGGGSLEALVGVYLATPKRAQEDVGKSNVSRLRTVCRVALERELAEVTCRQVGPELWSAYHKNALAAAGRAYNLTTRYRENKAINACVRAARSLFIPAMLRAYKTAGLDVRADAGLGDTLPEPYVPPAVTDDEALQTAWKALKTSDERLWLIVGLARFAGLRREEIANCRGHWIEITPEGAVSVALRDRPEENFWTKTGKPYRANVIEPSLAKYLQAAAAEKPGELIVSDPPNEERGRYFERVPQSWLREHGLSAAPKPLHRLRGLYADHIAKLTADAITARLAGLRAAQEALGHTTVKTTENHYLTPDALR